MNAATGGIGSDLLSSGATALLAGFSQDQEAEADTLGVRYIARAGYDPNAMSSMFKNMELDSRLTDLAPFAPEARLCVLRFDLNESHQVPLKLLARRSWLSSPTTPSVVCGP